MIRRSTYLPIVTLALALAGCGDSSHAPDSTSAAPPPSSAVPSRPSQPAGPTAALRRQQQLREYGLSSEADLEAAEFEAKGAEYDMHGWQALVESSHSEIHRLEIQLDQTRLRAPFSGVVVRRYVREGQTVAKNDKCFRISQLAPLQVQFQVSETSPKRPERGAPVDLSLADNSGRTFSARVVKVSPTVDPASDSYDVTAQLIGNGIADLRPGMAVHVIWPGTAKAKP